jgi:hypothetical protein
MLMLTYINAKNRYLCLQRQRKDRKTLQINRKQAPLPQKNPKKPPNHKTTVLECVTRKIQIVDTRGRSKLPSRLLPDS